MTFTMIARFQSTGHITMRYGNKNIFTRHISKQNEMCFAKRCYIITAKENLIGLVLMKFLEEVQLWNFLVT